MMEQNKTALNLIALISNTNCRKQFFEFLEIDDLINLLCLNKEINSQLLLKTPILRRVYFLTFLKQREMFTYFFCQSQSYKKLQYQKVDNILSNTQNQFIGNVSIMKALKNQITHNLNNIVQKEDSKQIVDDIFETIINPPIPMPSLRKETVGDYSNSIFQILMAELNWRDNSFKIEQQPYRTLKVELLNNHEKILEQLKSNENLLVKIRFQSELIETYTPTESPFLNVIVSFLSMLDYHLKSIRNYFQFHLELSSFEFLSQFTKRYNTFRDMVLAFEEKLGFVFELFTKAFNFLQPELEIYPGCSIWRTLMKKWVSMMKPFEGKIAEGYIQLLIRVRQRNFQQMMEEQHKLEECSYKINANFIMKNRLVEHNNLIVSEELDVITNEDPDAITIILNEYVEYLIDTSVNQYSVHWCQSSIQKLSSIYNNNERLIIESTKQLYKNWNEIFENSPILKQAYEHDIDYLRNILKPNTLSKIIQEANLIIQDVYNKSQKLIKGGFQHLDDRIRFLNEKKMIPLQLQLEHQQFFDFDKTISLDKIESIIREITKINSCDEQLKIERGQSLIQVEE